jgi:hypothetical protein
MPAASKSNSRAGDAYASPTLRWVVLQHDVIPDRHFDLMIESKPGGSLHTWRCPQNPVAQHMTMAVRIANHRQRYLDYEGEVSGNRGRVVRVAAGAGRIRRIRQRVWLWETGDAMLVVAYRLTPVVTADERRWVIEQHASAGQTE